MYKFVTISGSCGGAYDLGKAESTANQMEQNGYDLVQVYQTSTAACIGGTNSALTMVFRAR